MSVDERLVRSLAEVEGLFAGGEVPPFHVRRGPRSGVVAVAAAAVIVAALVGVAILRAADTPPVATVPPTTTVTPTTSAAVTTPPVEQRTRAPGTEPFDEASTTGNWVGLNNWTAMDILYVDAEGRTGLAEWVFGSPAPTVVGTADQKALAADFLRHPVRYLFEDGSPVEGWDNVATWVTDEPDPGTLWIGAPGDAVPVASGVTGWVVDEEESYITGVVDRDAAWTSRPPGADETRLYTASLVGADRSITVTEVGVVPDGAQLFAWGNWGFLLNIPAVQEHRRWPVPDPARGKVEVDLVVTQILDTDGAVHLTFPAETIYARGDGDRGLGTLQVTARPTLAAYAAATDEMSPADLGLPDGVNGAWLEPAEGEIGPWPAEALVTLFFDGVSPRAGVPWTTDGAVLIADGASLGAYAVTTGDTILRWAPQGGGLAVDFLMALYTGDHPYAPSFIEGATEYLEFDLEGGVIFRGDDQLIFAVYGAEADAPVPFDLGRVLAVGFR